MFIKKLTISTLALCVGVVSLPVLAASDTDYDSKANDLVANILQILDNDVPPTETGNSTTFSSNEIININVLTPFTKKGSGYALTSKSLNARRNGGMLLKDVQAAVDYMAAEKLTKYTTAESFQADASLRRDEAAKFFGVFAKEVMHKRADTTKTCAFTDLSGGHSDLKNNIIEACQLGIFNGKDGYFYPTQSLTNGEALAVLLRITNGKMDESNANHWATAYWQKAQTYGLTQGTFMDSPDYLDQPVTRGNIARMLEAASYIAALKLQIGSDISYSMHSQGYIPSK